MAGLVVRAALDDWLAVAGGLKVLAEDLAAGRAAGLTRAQLCDAQGIVLGMASGTLGFLDEGAWNKRLHAGWASVAGSGAGLLSAAIEA